MRATIVIPARLGSTRLERKLLKSLSGESVLRRTISACIRVPDVDVIVATDSDEIFSHVVDLGCRIILTGKCKNGTERVASVIDHITTDIVINVQGDEPLVEAEDLDRLITITELQQCVTTLYRKLEEDELLDGNVVKVLIDQKGLAGMFTRSPLFQKLDNCYKHIGIYGFSRSLLKKISDLDETENSRSNSLEQISWMENGIPVYMTFTEKRYISIDTEGDLKKAEIVLKHYENIH
jgi:3-deoxy-manno-octulosonate cytidylyltransferase (CMP-KDO synthetase)